MENQDRKREVIIEAAVKRFAIYGLNKTTMTEIASDLSLSKALLYYYFPDKINLYAEVLVHVIKLIADDIQSKLADIADSKEALYTYLTLRHEYLKKYYNVFESLRKPLSELPTILFEVLKSGQVAETDQIFLALQKQENHIDNAEAASILYDAFVGMRSPIFHSQMTYQLDPEVFDNLLKRQKKLGEIFLKGIKA